MFPTITVSSFLNEISKKFRIAFFINDANKTVLIRSFNTLLTNEAINASSFSLDGVTKRTDSNLFQTSQRFFDEKIELDNDDQGYDPSLDSIITYLEYVYTDPENNDPEDNKFISSVMAVTSMIKVLFPLNYISSSQQNYWVGEGEENIRILTPVNMLTIDSSSITDNEFR
jgi:hypothetical protein